mgnify:CR=1 FL=1
MKKFMNIIFDIKLISLILFLVFVTILLVTGNVKYYIYPKMNIFLIFAGLIIIVLIINRIVTNTGLKKNKLKNNVFLISIILALFYAPDSLEEIMSKNRGADFSTGSYSADNNFKSDVLDFELP